MSKQNKKPFYITTTLPYVNAEPHIGFAMELIRADIIARSMKLNGREVFFNTGTDEHGIKVYRKSKEQGIEVQKYVDQYASKFKELISILGIMPEITFTRTTDPHHIQAAQEFWEIADKQGCIYKKNYSVKYCVGCELEKMESELVDGKCPIHPLMEMEIIEEENYFFRFSIFQKQLLDLYEKNPNFVRPNSRLNEIRAFVERGLEDFSISRLRSKMPWGIPVPTDENHVMYVWFDALVNYISAIGWPDKMDDFQKWWVLSGGVVQYCGKDNLRQQSAMWQAMLMSVKLPPSQTIIVEGFITGEGGIKMSKSLGNTVNPLDIVKEYGLDALRYFVAREIHPFEDGPFSAEQFKNAYNAHLANGLGNLVSRVLKMATANEIKFDEDLVKELSASTEVAGLQTRYEAGLNEYDLQKATNAIWELINNTDKIVQERQPFKKIKTDKPSAEKDIKELLARLDLVGTMLLPILPRTGETILDLVQNNKMPEASLFPRSDLGNMKYE